MSDPEPNEQTLPGRLAARARTQPTAAAYYANAGGAWQATEWQAYADSVWRAGRAFLAAGLEPGARVAIVSDNRPEWAHAYLGAMAAGCVPVGVASSLSVDAARVLVDSARADMVVLDRPRLARELGADASSGPRVVALSSAGDHASAPGLVSWHEFLSTAEQVAQDALDERTRALTPESAATVAYTAGTTGPAKGVLLTHGSLTTATDALVDALELSESDRLLSYLPFAHLLEQLFSICVPVTVGALLHHAESFGRAGENLRHVQPSVFVGVPQVYRQMHASVSRKLARTTGWQRSLIDWSRVAATHLHDRRSANTRPGLGARAAYRVANYLVLGKMKTALGLGKARLCISSTGALPRATQAFFRSLDLPIHELYGQVETCYAVSVARPGAPAPGTAGEPLPGVQVRILELPPDMADARGLSPSGALDAAPGAAPGVGEIAVRAGARADGDQPWSRTGDLGFLDPRGRLVVLGRLDQCLRVRGQTVVCEPIERALTAHPLVREAVLANHPDGGLGVLLSLDPEVCDQYSSQPGVSRDARELARDPELVAAISALLEQVRDSRAVMQSAPPIERFAILDLEFTVERGEWTPVLNVARATVRERYADQLDDGSIIPRT